MPWGLFILLGVGLLAGWAMLVVYTAWILTHPTRRGYGHAVARGLPGDPSELVLPGAARGLKYSEWTFRSRGRELPVWDVEGLAPDGPVIVVTHGWGDSRVLMLPRLAGLATPASRVVLWDLPRHGDAPGGGFTLGAHEHEDLLAILEQMTGMAMKDEPGGPIMLYGASLGAGSSIVAAAILAGRGGWSPAAVIAEAPYRIPPVPARNVLRLRGLPYRSNLLPAMGVLGLRFGYGLSWALSESTGGFDRALHAARLPRSIPLLLLHGSEDPVCPVQDSRAIDAAAPASRLIIVQGASHNNLWSDEAFAPVCSRAVREFLAGLPRDGMPDGPAAEAVRLSNPTDRAEVR